MALDSKKNLEKNVVELTISVPGDKFEEAIQKAYRRNKLNVPGFRKGKAPRSIIEKMYGKGVFYDDAIEALYPAAYDDAVEEAGITPVDRADLSIISADENGFSFKAVVTVKPEVSVKDYKGLKVNKIKRPADEKDVEAELKNQQKKLGRLIEVAADDVTINGDTVVFDFDGYCDGKPFDGGKANDYNLVLGSGQFIPGFEEQMIGKKAGDEFSVNVKFPDDYHAEELKGKDAEFKIVLHEIKREELPEINDEFAKDVSDFDTLDEYKADILKKAQERNDQISDRDLDDAISAEIINILEADIPSCMIENEVNFELQQFEQRFASQGISLESYLKYTGQTIDDLKNIYRPGAEGSVKIRLALEKIAEIEGIVISDEEIDEEYKKFAENNNVDIEKIKTPSVSESIAKDISIRKAFEIVKNNAVVTEISQEEADKLKDKEKEAKPAAKKPRKKKTETAEAAPAEEASEGEAVPAEKKAAKPRKKKTEAPAEDKKDAE